MSQTFVDGMHAVIDFDSAESFIQCLDFSRGLIHPMMSFRGEGSDRNELRPSSWRSCSKSYSGLSGESLRKAQISLEARKLLEFSSFSNEQGLALLVPPDELFKILGHHANNPDSLTNTEIRNWPPKVIWPLVGLAQHYGVETSFLDWTTKPLVAAYFAAEACLRSNAERMALWCINWRPFEYEIETHINRLSEMYPGLLVYKPAYQGNVNIQSQSGLFMLVMVEKHEVDIPYDKIIIGRKNNSTNEYPFLVLTLDRIQARRLFVLLHYTGVTGASLFPGYVGAARSANLVDVAINLEPIEKSEVNSSNKSGLRDPSGENLNFEKLLTEGLFTKRKI